MATLLRAELTGGGRKCVRVRCRSGRGCCRRRRSARANCTESRRPEISTSRAISGTHAVVHSTRCDNMLASVVALRVHFMVNLQRRNTRPVNISARASVFELWDTGHLRSEPRYNMLPGVRLPHSNLRWWRSNTSTCNRSTYHPGRTFWSSDPKSLVCVHEFLRENYRLEIHVGA
jgi:hypothetical protein